MSDSYDKIRTELELTKLMVDIRKLMVETRKFMRDTENVELTMEKTRLETAKLARDLWWQPFLSGAAIVGAIAGLVVAVLKIKFHG